jgi:hypothetical protein
MVQPKKRWLVELSFGWLYKHRERQLNSSAQLVTLALLSLGLNNYLAFATALDVRIEYYKRLIETRQHHGKSK